LVEKLKSVSQPLANARREVADTIGNHVSELSVSLKTLAGPISPTSDELAADISGRITELSEMLNRVVTESHIRGSVRN
ncbi:MAG: hypothetical protein J4N93_03360, partial [Chloroflexi bacterium]|nr:hypothetical protein [Chloroflexota bacterium]